MNMREYSPLYNRLCVGRGPCLTTKGKREKDRFLSRGAAETAIEIIYERREKDKNFKPLKGEGFKPLKAYYCNDTSLGKGCRLWHLKTDIEAMKKESPGGLQLAS